MAVQGWLEGGALGAERCDLAPVWLLKGFVQGWVRAGKEEESKQPTLGLNTQPMLGWP